jgi:transposase-like protein
MDVPRARVREGTGTAEWRSEMLPRYQRRTARVDDAILGVYLAGSNSRRIRTALAPSLRGGPLSFRLNRVMRVRCLLGVS